MRILVLLACLAFVPPAQAAKEEKSALIGFANDYAGVLTASQMNALEQQLSRVNQGDRYQMAVAIHPKLPEGAERDSATELADRLLVGSALKDRGLVFFVFLAEKVVRLEVGYGLEELVPDAHAHRIAEKMAARMAKGEIAPALEEAIAGLEPALDPLERIERKDDRWQWLPDAAQLTIEAVRGIAFYASHYREFPKQLSSWWRTNDDESRKVLSGMAVLLALFVAGCLRPVLGSLLFLVLPGSWSASGAFWRLFFWGTDAALGRMLREGGAAPDKFNRTFAFADMLIYVWAALGVLGLALGLFITVVGHPGGFGGAGAWAQW
jgi:uncharacterized membrane protein YgcG